MPDFGQYTDEDVFSKLKELSKYDAKFRNCCRCGKRTKAGLIFGQVICNECWKKQTARNTE